MEGAIFDCPASWEPWLPPQVRRLTDVVELTGREWGLLALTAAGCAKLTGQEIRCELLLLPGDCPLRRLDGVRPRHAVSYGLSPRDSLTLSSLRQPVLCVQRTLPMPDGEAVEPQEIPLLDLPAPAVQLLPLLGLRLLGRAALILRGSGEGDGPSREGQAP